MYTDEIVAMSCGIQNWDSTKTQIDGIQFEKDLWNMYLT